MSKMNSKFKYMFDAEPSITLIPKNGTPNTATFNSTSKVLDVIQGYWNVPALDADNVFAIAINVAALDTTTGDEVYTLELEVGNAGYAVAKRIQKLTVTKPGQYVFLVDMDTANAVLGQRVAELRIAATLAGTTPSITLNAWLAGQIVDGL